jgi:hypothetical protein
MKYPISLMSIRVHGTCHNRACDGWHPAHGSPLSQVFLRNLQRRHARNFRISLACLRWSGLSGPFRLPTFFSVSGLPVCDGLRTFVSAVLAAMGLLRDGFRLGGEADGADDPDPEDRVGEPDFLMGTGIARIIVPGLTAGGDREPEE